MTLPFRVMSEDKITCLPIRTVATFAAPCE